MKISNPVWPLVALWASFSLIATGSAAQTAPDQSDPLWRDELKSAPSTMSVVQPSQLTPGDIFVGLAMQPEENSTKANLDNFHIGPVPQAALGAWKDQKVCASLLSVDGRYTGDVVYSVEAGKKPPYHVEYNSVPSHAKEVAKLFGAGNVRSFATLGEDCERVHNGILVASGFTNKPHFLVATLGFANAVVDLWLDPVDPNSGDKIELEECRRSWAVDGGLDCMFDVSNAPSGDYILGIEIRFSGLDPISHSVTTRLP